MPPYFYVLCFFWLGSQIPVEQQSESDEIQQQFQNENIYTSGGATISGLENIHTTYSVGFVERSPREQPVVEPSKEKKIIIVAENSKEPVVKPEYESHVTFSNTNSSSSLFLSVFNTKNVCVPAVTPSLKSLQKKVDLQQALVVYQLQNSKQIYYTSLSYLQFGKYRNSSLRAPPSM